MLLAGLLEGVGIAVLLPLLNIVLAGTSESMSAVGRYTESMLLFLGLTPTLGSMLGIIVVVITAKAALLVFAARQIGYTAAFVTMLLRQRLLRALMEARWSFFVQNRTGSLTAAMSNEPARAASCFVQICRILTGFIQVLVYVALAIAVSWEVSIAAISVGVLTVVLLNRFVVIVGRVGHKQTGLNRSLLSQLIDGLQTMKSIKSMGREESLARFLSHDIEEMNRLQRIQIASKEALNHYRDPIATIALAGCVYLLVTFWELTPESLFVMALLFMRIASRISGLQSAQQGVAGSLPGFWFIRAVLTSASVAKERLRGGATPSLRKQIELRSVSFAYGKKRILSNVDLSIPAGAFVAVVGPSGSGKTTLADLVIGLLTPKSGEVLIDGTPMAEVDAYEWRRSIGYVPQETVLFHDTILNNVTLGEDSISYEEVCDALKRAGAWGFVEQLTNGVDTMVGERGAKLSGGQRQRIAIARALVRKPALLVLDEATTALDPQTEAGICESLRELSGKVTILAISHQPAMRNAADIAYRVNSDTHKLELATPDQSQAPLLQATE
ncbi:MAG TPA: ABC transporter ATP-binding protein [Kiloniellaceae bacterium]|nr:ABC transporter ATP-binding protein [Kiloniellaceae bacterium]